MVGREVSTAIGGGGCAYGGSGRGVGMIRTFSVGAGGGRGGAVAGWHDLKG
jgi:hypothetical protein